MFFKEKLLQRIQFVFSLGLVFFLPKMSCNNNLQYNAISYSESLQAAETFEPGN